MSWELIEREEGRCDWSSVDALIRNARARDQQRLPRAALLNGQGVDILSAMASTTLEADSRAFAALLMQIWEDNGARTQGTWSEILRLGRTTGEIFAAWHYARFANALTASGKAAYGLPIYVNVAQNRPGRLPDHSGPLGRLYRYQ